MNLLTGYSKGTLTNDWILTALGGHRDINSFMGASKSEGYYGLASPTGDSTTWIRTTTSGLLPASSGGASSLGTQYWPFNKAYISTIYGTLIGNADTATNIKAGAKGSIPYQSDSNKTSFLSAGTTGQVLKMGSSGIPIWSTDNNTDTKVSYTAATVDVDHPILFANNSTDTGAPTTGAVYYESNSTDGAGLTYNPSTNTLNIPTGLLKINTTVADHTNPSNLCLLIYTPSTTSTITAKNSPGIGFLIEGKNWGSLVFNSGVFEFSNGDFSDNHSVKASRFISTTTTVAPFTVNSKLLVSNLNADLLDGYHASSFVQQTDLLTELEKFESVCFCSKYHFDSGSSSTNNNINITYKLGIQATGGITKTSNTATFTFNRNVLYAISTGPGTNVSIITEKSVRLTITDTNSSGFYSSLGDLICFF